jgi:hypothetical protein
MSVNAVLLDDPVEPGAKLDLLVGVAQRKVRLGERLLGDVIGPLGGDDRGGVAAQRRAVAPEDLLEGGFVAGPDEGHEPSVGLKAQRPSPEETGGQAAGIHCLVHSSTSTTNSTRLRIQELELGIGSKITIFEPKAGSVRSWECAGAVPVGVPASSVPLEMYVRIASTLP